MRARYGLILLSAALLGGPALAQGTIPPEILASCEGCHGTAGQTRTPQTPRLNGQTREYLAARLTDLRYPGTQTIAAIHAMLGPARGIGDNTDLTGSFCTKRFDRN
jgi:cytochrome c553